MTSSLARRAAHVSLGVALSLTVACSAVFPKDAEPAGSSPSSTPEPVATASIPPRLAQSAWFRSACSLPLNQLRRIVRGYYPNRSPDVMYVPNPIHVFNGFAHSGPWAEVQEVPLVLYGPGFIDQRGTIESTREVTVADLAPTYAELLDYDLPHEVDGTVLEEALLPRAQRPDPPRLIVTIVWDGAGINVLDSWPDAWPELDRLATAGTSIVGATVGSSPSVTPPVHATIGTGMFPNRHGIVDIPQRKGRDLVEDSWKETSPRELLEPTLGDVYDVDMDNEPVVGMMAERAWQLGMIGHGADHPGGDRDVGVLTRSDSFGELFTNEDVYELPNGLEDPQAFERALTQVDAEDGELDDAWLDHELLDDPEQFPWTPTWTLYQTGIVKKLLRDERFGVDDTPDLFYVNYKQTDHVGHRWSLAAPEMEEAIRYQDQALAELVEMLDRRVGKDRYVIALTADHGAQPPPEITDGWLIDQDPMTVRAEASLGAADGELVEEDRPVGFWLKPKARSGTRPVAELMSEYLTRYTVAQDLGEDEVVPDHLLPHERLFDAAFPMKHLPQIWRCALERRDG